MKLRTLCYLLCFVFLLNLTACSFAKNTSSQDTNSVTVGTTLKIKNTNDSLILLDNKDTLAANGLYYATWTIGNSIPYENSDGETVDLYDAQLYLVLGEAKNSDEAQTTLGSWLSAAKDNYEISKEEESSFNGQSYTILTYNCKSSDNPYAHGISAFATNQSSAVCIELTCQENFTDNLQTILEQFLKDCSFSTNQED
jgi:hypothetical protein